MLEKKQVLIQVKSEECILFRVLLQQHKTTTNEIVRIPQAVTAGNGALLEEENGEREIVCCVSE
jgi:hypothetical protein